MPAAQKSETSPPVVNETRKRRTTVVEEELKTPEKLAQFVVFALGGEEYGIEILDVKEIVKAGRITLVPNTPDFISGIINLRGKIVVVIDLKERFLLGDEQKKEQAVKHIVIAWAKDDVVGLLVDEVTEVLRLPEDAIKPAPEQITKKMHFDYVKSIGTINGRLIILLDMAKVLSTEELAKLSEVSEKHYRKAEASEGTLEGKKETTEKEVPEKHYRKVEAPEGKDKKKEDAGGEKKEIEEEGKK